ncbi:MAG: winged helix-turn-helix domain-containing protein [Sulfuricaulis sp.]|nr:winged helix-turn-helix domain-containing protein [Sulfuricaulis sp.]
MDRVRDLVDRAFDAAFAIDDRCRVTALNAKAEQLFGHASDEVIGRCCGEVLQAVLPGGEPLCAPNCEAIRCFQSCMPYGVPSCRIRRKDGDWVSVGISSLVLSRRAREPHPGSVVAVIFLHEKEPGHIQAPPHGTMQVFMLGGFGLAVGGRGVDFGKWKRKQAVTLLKYLVTQVGRQVHRERILDSLWPNVDEDRGWDRLKVTMCYLRRQLCVNGMGEDVLKTVGDAYLLRRDAVSVDAETFERLVAEGGTLQRCQQWDEALRRYNEAEHLYRGDYLEEDAYTDWCAEERERLRELYLEMLADMAQCNAKRGHYAEAARVCRKALVREPCRESFHRALMEYLAWLGHPDRAVAQFHACQRVLARELGVDPTPETQQLYHQILEGAAKAKASRHPALSDRLQPETLASPGQAPDP